jgi:hypothetical protein
MNSVRSATKMTKGVAYRNHPQACFNVIVLNENKRTLKGIQNYDKDIKRILCTQITLNDIS